MVHKNLVIRMPGLKEGPHCEDCALSKQAKISFTSGVSQMAKMCLQLVHMDLCGPMNEDSLGGNKYFYFLVDDYSRWCWIYLLENKSDAFDSFHKFQVLVERQTGLKLKSVRSDRGGEFLSQEFQKYCETLAIKREFSAPHTPQ